MKAKFTPKMNHGGGNLFSFFFPIPVWLKKSFNNSRMKERIFRSRNQVCPQNGAVFYYYYYYVYNLVCHMSIYCYLFIFFFRQRLNTISTHDGLAEEIPRWHEHKFRSIGLLTAKIICHQKWIIIIISLFWAYFVNILFRISNVFMGLELIFLPKGIT